MKKSFTWLISLVVLLGFFSIQASAVDGIAVDKVWPKDEGTEKAYSKTTDKLKITFFEAVAASTGSIRLFEGGALIRVIPATDSRVSISDKIVEVDVSADLEQYTAYSVTVDAGAFKSVSSGTASAAYPSTGTWTFTTGDYIAPVLVEVEPEDGTLYDSPFLTLNLTFADVTAVTAGEGQIAVYKADGNIWHLVTLNFGVNATISDNGDGTYQLQVTGIRQLQDTESYYVTVDAGVVTDQGHNADGKPLPYAGLTDITTWTFGTEDFTAPVWASGYPKKSNVGNDSFDVLVKVNEAGTAYGVISATALTATEIRGHADVVEVDVTGGTEAALSFDGLSESTAYTVYLVVDNDDTPGTVVKSITVTTGETVAPVLLTVKYDYSKSTDDTETVTSNIVGVNNDVELDLKAIRLTFDEEIKLGAGNIIISRVADNSVFATVASTVMKTAADGGTWVEFPLSGLENNTIYKVIIPNSLVMDVYGNKYPGISSVTGWRFTSSDDIAPTYTITPAHASADVDADTKIVLTFDEVVNATAGHFQLKDKDGSTLTFGFAKNDNDNKFSVITLTPTNPLPSGQLVRLIISEASIMDPSGNKVSNQNNTIAFFVEDTAGPVISSWTGSPLNSATKAIEIKYNEGIYLLGGTEITADNLFSIITVKKNTASGQNVAVNYAISADKKTITLTPVTEWASEGVYYVAVSSDVEDAAGNKFEGTDASRSTTYTIKDLVPETVDINVAGKTISTGDAITVKFKEGTAIEARGSLRINGTWKTVVAGELLADMESVIVLKEGDADGADVPFTVGGTNGDFTVTATLEGNKTYYIGVGPSTKDADGNVNIANFVTFNTKYESTPEVVSLSPADGAKEVAASANFVITFNTAVQLGTYVLGDINITDGTNVVDIASSEITINSAGTQVTINPASNLATDTEYDIIIAAGVFLNKNATTEGNDAFVAGDWNFVTKDTKLDVVSLTPDEVLDAKIDDELVIEFGEDVQVGTGNIDIKDFDSDAIIERIAVSSDQVEIDDETVTITPSADFKYAKKYYVEVAEGAFLDMVVNKSKEIFGKTATGLTDWTFTTADPAVEIVKVTPANGTDKVGVTSSIVVEFNREVKAGTGSIGYIEDDGTNTQIQSYPIGSSNITISGKTLTITHTDKDFPADTKIWLYIEAGSIVVQTGAGASVYDVSNTTTESYSFHTGDVNPPKPTFNPAAFNSSAPVYVDVDTEITITFDEDIFHKNNGTNFTSGDITDGGVFRLYKAVWNTTTEEWDGNGSPISFVGAISGRTVTMVPDVDLDEFTAYMVVINNTGVVGDGVADALGQETPVTTSVFHTTDNTAPAVSFTLTGGAGKVVVGAVTVTDANPNKFYYLVREKSSDVAPTAAEIKAAKNKNASTGTVATFDITGLAASTTYQLFYVADDKFGNTSAVAVKEASTDDTVAPLLVSSDPETGAVDVDITASGEIEIELTFNEDVVAGTGNIVLREQGTHTIVATYDAATVLSAGDDDDQLVLTLTGLPADASVMNLYVEMAKGTVVDKATPANPFAGIFGANAIHFSTEDNKVPTFVHDDSDGKIATNENIKLKFSEAVQTGTGKAILYKGSVAVANAVEVFDAKDVSFNGTSVVIDPSADLINGQTYVLAVGADFALDMSGNKNGNAAGTITFTVDVNEAPYVVSNNSGANPVQKSSLSWIDVDMSEPIYFDIDGIRTNILLLTDAQIKANELVKFEDGDGNPVPFTMYQCCDHDVVLQISQDVLNHSSTYVLTIQGFVDDKGLVMTPYSYTYMTTDGQIPVITFNPADEEENVQPDTELTLTFSEQIYRDAWISGGEFYYTPIDNDNVDAFVYLEDASGTAIPFTATFNGVDLITIVPGVELESGATYTYGLLQNVEDKDGNALTPGEGQGKSWAVFTVADVVEPVIGEVNASNFAPLGTGVSATADMWVKFSEEIEVSTGAVVIRREDGTIFQTISGADLSVDEDEPGYLFIDHDDFEVYTNYFVELEASVVVDKSGNPNAAYSDAENGWKFTTNDTFTLELSADPAPLGAGQPNLVDLSLWFNKNVYKNVDAVYGSYLAVYKEDGTAVAQIPVNNLVIVGNRLTYYNLELDVNQAYYARLEANSIVDASGNKFAGIMDNSWEFSTMESIAPKLVETMPADDDIAVSPLTSFSMTFDRDIALGTGMISIRYSADGSVFEDVDVTTATVSGSTLSFAVSQPLDMNTSFYVLVPSGAVTNTEVSADPYAGITNTYTWNFTTAESIGLELISWSPTGIIEEIHPTFEMVFNTDVVLGAEGGNLVVTAVGSDEAALTLALSEEMFDGKVITVTYDEGVSGMLMSATEYFVTIEEGVIADTLGNAWEGIYDETVWTFTTGVREYTIAEIQGDADVSPLLDEMVKVTGTVTGISAGEGFFMQDANAGWSGIWVAYTDVDDLAIGDGVVVTGVVDEVANVTTIIANEVMAADAPVVVEAIVLDSPSAAKAEMYESVLVQVLGARGTAADEGNGEWTIYYEETDNVIVNDWLYVYAPVEGHFFNVTGVVNGRLEAYKLEPRMESDIVDLTVTEAQIISGVEFKVYPNPFNDRITIENHDKLTRVLVTNIAGQRVLDLEYPTREIRTANLVSGVYVVSMFTEDGLAKTERIVKR